LDEDFIQAVLEEVPQRERPELDELFGVGGFDFELKP
jgi:hypothetical protein